MFEIPFPFLSDDQGLLSAPESQLSSLYSGFSFSTRALVVLGRLEYRYL